MTRSLGLLACFAALGCGAEPAEKPTEARPACVREWICGLTPPSRPVEDGTAYELATVVGERFWVAIPGRSSGVVAVPRIPLGVNADLTTATPREAADRFCDGFRRCRATAVDRSGAITRWDDASGTIRDLGVTTVDLGEWTLVILEPDAARAERVALGLEWSVDDDGYPRVRGDVDADWAGVSLWMAEDVLVDIVPGCEHLGPELSLHPPDTVAGGAWCADGHSVDVSFVDRSELDLLHANLRISPGPAPR